MGRSFTEAESLELLARASELLGSSTDLEATLENIIGAFVPELADACVIELDDDTRRAQAVLPDGDIKARRALPLTVGDGSIGTITLGLGNRGHSFDDVHAIVSALAHHAAVAIHNARLFAEIRVAQYSAEEQAIELEEQAVELEYANEQLTDAEAEQRALIEAMRDVVLVLDRQGHYVRVPHTAPDLLYAPSQDLVGQRMHDVMPKEVADDFLAVIRAALDRDRPQQIEYPLPIGDRQVWFSAVVSPMADDQVLWVARDVTVQKQAEQALRDSEARYRLLFESNPMPMWVYDRETLRFLSVNTAAMKQYGYTRDEFLNMTLLDIRPAQDIDRLKAAVLDSRAELHHSAEWRHRRKDGSMIEVEITAHPLEFGGRDAELILAHDVTLRRRAEAKLREHAEILRALIDDSPLAIISADTDLHITRWNPAAERLFGWSPEEMIGKSYLQIIPPERAAEFHDFFRTISEGGVVNSAETVRRRRDGSTFPATVSVAALRAPDGSMIGFMGILADISERKRVESELQQAQKMEAVGRLAGGIAHDFNNLLTAINGHIGFVIEDLLPSDPKRADLEQVSIAAERAASLTRQLLAFSRNQAQQPEIVDVSAEIKSLSRLMRRVLRDDIDLTVHGTAEKHLVLIDPVQLQQVLMNLCLNARDAMPEGGRIQIAVRSEHVGPQSAEAMALHPGNYVLIAVADTGAGMPAAVREHVFEPFFTTKGQGKGTGLGLSTAYGIVKRAHGHITVHSEVGRGTTFSILLPPADGPVVSENGSRKTVMRSVGGKTILVAEDDPTVRSLTVRILARAGYDVLQAINGKDALEVFRQRGQEIDLLVTDVMMPEMRGHDLVTAVLAHQPDLKIVMMSGYVEADPPTLPDSVVYIEKPFSAQMLTSTISKLLSHGS